MHSGMPCIMRGVPFLQKKYGQIAPNLLTFSAFCRIFINMVHYVPFDSIIIGFVEVCAAADR